MVLPMQQTHVDMYKIAPGDNLGHVVYEVLSTWY